MTPLDNDHDALIRLQERVGALEESRDEIVPIVRNLQAWQKTVLAFTVLIGALCTFFADQVKHILGVKG